MATVTAPLAELEQRILDGDKSVTPAQLAAARAAAEHQTLIGQADQLAAEREATAQLDADRQALHQAADTALTRALTTGRDAYTAYVTAHADLVAAIKRHNSTVADLNARARKLGLDDIATPLTADTILDAAHQEVLGRPRLARSAMLIGTTIRPGQMRRHPFHSDAHVAQINERLARQAEATFAAERDAKLTRQPDHEAA